MNPTIASPDWMKPSPQCSYALTAYSWDGGEVQGAELTVEEYDALKAHLAKLRGLIPEEHIEAHAAADPVDGETAIPQVHAIRLALSRFDQCISLIEENKGFLVKKYAEHPRLVAELLADAVILERTLTEWNGDLTGNDLTGEGALVTAFRSNLDL
jgi:hypothetical protein